MQKLKIYFKTKAGIASGWSAEKNYISVGVLENIAADTSLRYFSIDASSGFDGFIIYKGLLLTVK